MTLFTLRNPHSRIPGCGTTIRLAAEGMHMNVLSKPLFVALAVATASLAFAARSSAADPNQVLEWNQIFIDTLIATNTANSSSQRLGAIVHTAIFDAYNGIERRYTPIFVQSGALPGASRRAAVIAAAHTALVGLFPSRQAPSTPAMRRRSRR